MTIKKKLEADVKQAMLAGDKTRVMILRGLKSVILYAEVAKGRREEGLTDSEVIDLFMKEVKKRQESATMYAQGGNQERAQAEQDEKKVIEQYLPTQLDEAELNQLIDAAIETTGPFSTQTMGRVIGQVKQDSHGKVEGSRIAVAVKERLKVPT